MGYLGANLGSFLKGFVMFSSVFVLKGKMSKAGVFSVRDKDDRRRAFTRNGGVCMSATAFASALFGMGIFSPDDYLAVFRGGASELVGRLQVRGYGVEVGKDMLIVMK